MRQTGRYSSSLSGKSSLLVETVQVMRELAANAPIEMIRKHILEDNLLLKRTLATRKTVWETVSTRFISDRDEQQVRTIACVVTSPLPERDRHLVLFYELAMALPLVYDLTVDLLYPLYQDGRHSVGKEDVFEWFDQAESQGHDEIGQWSPQTRDKVASNYLTVARDFGLLEGTQRKTFARPYVPLPTFVYILYRMKDEGQSAKAIVTSDDYRLFLMDQRDVYLLLEEATRTGYVTFQRAGDIYDLTFHYRDLAEVSDELVRQV